MKESYKIDLPEQLKIKPYTELFTYLYNSKYRGSYAVQAPYKTDEKNLRSRDNTEIYIFYEKESSLEPLEKQVNQLKKEIIEEMKEIIQKCEINCKKDTYES